jgi:hypothetical protein
VVRTLRKKVLVFATFLALALVTLLFVAPVRAVAFYADHVEFSDVYGDDSAINNPSYGCGAFDGNCAEMIVEKVGEDNPTARIEYDMGSVFDDEDLYFSWDCPTYNYHVYIYTSRYSDSGYQLLWSGTVPIGQSWGYVFCGNEFRYVLVINYAPVADYEHTLGLDGIGIWQE